MNILEKEIQELVKNETIDWKKIKEILCGIAQSLKVVCDILPPGIIKSIICGISSLLLMICNLIPG